MEDWKKKQLDETYKKWEATGLLDGLNKDMIIHTKKVNMAELMESEASKLLK